MAVIKYNDTELDYNDIEKAVINGIDNFFNSNSFYGTPRSNGTYKRKYEDLRLQDRQAIMKVLGDMRNNDNVVVTASGITWNNGLDGLINDPSHRRAAGYIAKTLMNMPGKPKPEKKKLSRDILNKELVSLIGDVSSLSKEYRTKAYNDAISYILSKYTNLDDYDIAEGFDWNDYSNRLTQAQQALGTDDIEDDKYWLHNRLGIPITEDKVKVASNYDANTNNFILGLTAFGLSRQEAEEYYNTQVRQALIQKYVEDFMNKNKVSSTPTAPSTNAGVSASSSQTRTTPKVSNKTESKTPPKTEWTQDSLTNAIINYYRDNKDLSDELRTAASEHKDDWFKQGRYQDKVFFGSDGKLHINTKQEDLKRSRYAKKGGYLKLLKNYG